MSKHKVLRVIGPEGKALAIANAEHEFVVDYSIVDGHIDLDIGIILGNTSYITEEVSTHNSFEKAKEVYSSLLDKIKASMTKEKKETDNTDISLDQNTQSWKTSF